MDELKTLKDMEARISGVRCVVLSYLKQESIKWIKACCNRKKKCLGCHRMMKFHNIKGDDLQ